MEMRRHTSIKHCLFFEFVLESQATHDDLHNNMRLLSKGKALERFIEFKDELWIF